jgi:hypothetical protein
MLITSATSNTAGSGTTLTWGLNYKAGLVSYSTLWIDSANFSDPSASGSSNYRIGVVSSTNKGMLYQLVARLESNGDDAMQSLVRGYYMTWNVNDAKWLIDGNTSASWIINKSTTDFPY